LANIAKGDLAYVRNTTNGNTSFAYFADTGPGGKLGEGSMFLASAIGINSSPKTGGTSQPIIDYVVFPQSGLGQGTHLTLAQINSMGQTELTAAGGVTLPNCLNAQTPTLDCSNTVILTCGVTYSGASSTAASNVSTFGCNTWTETGPERVHSITPSANGTITATISNFTGDLDVYILASCDATDCLGTVSSSSATYTNAVAGNTYYVVVDADDGSGSAYNIVVTCPTVTGLDEINDSKTNDLVLYPNPTTGLIRIDAKNKNIDKIIIINQLGVIIETITLKNNEPINIEQYASGIYFFKIIDTEQQATFFKVIKE
jgi:hypothetical protein